MVEVIMVGSSDQRQAVDAIFTVRAQHDRFGESRPKALGSCLNAPSEVVDLVLVPQDPPGEFVLFSSEMVHITTSRSRLLNIV